MPTFEPFGPLNDRLLLRDASTEETTMGDADANIVRPETFRVKSNEGVVLSVGRTVPDDVRPGDIVKYSEFGAETIKVDGEELLLVRYMDLKGVRRAL